MVLEAASLLEAGKSEEIRMSSKSKTFQTCKRSRSPSNSILLIFLIMLRLEIMQFHVNGISLHLCETSTSLFMCMNFVIIDSLMICSRKCPSFQHIFLRTPFQGLPSAQFYFTPLSYLEGYRHDHQQWYRKRLQNYNIFGVKG